LSKAGKKKSSSILSIPGASKGKKSTKRKSPNIMLNDEVILEGKPLEDEQANKEDSDGDIFATAKDFDPYAELEKKNKAAKGFPEESKGLPDIIFDEDIIAYDYEFTIEDKSTNGTFLNDEKIGKNKSKELKNGDKIWLRVN